MDTPDPLSGNPEAPSPAGAGEPAPAPAHETPAPAIGEQLAAARERLDAKDLAGALAIYEEVLAAAGDRADVLVTISGDLGSTGHIPEIVELVAPRYDAQRHGPATGINLVQAYLALRNADAAQHILDILFALDRPELAERLHGFSNSIGELLTAGTVKGIPQTEALAPRGGPVGLALVTISRPIWAYGLEAVEGVLPAKEGRLRRIGFAQLAVPGAYPDNEAAMRQPMDELGRLSRAIPLWLSETFYFSPAYAPITALGCFHGADGSRRPAIFPSEWTVDNIKQLADTSADGLDYVLTGSLRRAGEEFVLGLRIWEVKKLRERKQISLRWTGANADAELKKLHEYVRTYMEWAPYPEGSGIPYGAPASAVAWLEALASLLALFLVEKQLMPRDQLGDFLPIFDAFAPHAFSPPSSSLAWISLRARAASLGLAPSLTEVLLSRHAAVARARTQLGM